MTLLPIAAGIEGIIWVIILIVWSIAQMVMKGRAAQRRPQMRPPGAPPPPPRQPAVPMERDLQELLRELTGQPPPLVQEVEMEEEEEEDAPLRPEPQPVRRAPPIPTPAQQLVQTLSTVTARRSEIEQSALAKAPLPQYVPSIGDLSEGRGSAFSHTGKMPGLTMKMPSMNLRASAAHNAPATSGNAAISITSLRNRNALRQTVIGQAILGKPKALESAPSAY